MVHVVEVSELCGRGTVMAVLREVDVVADVGCCQKQR